MCDPDDWYEGEIPNELTADVYENLRARLGLRYPRPQLFRSSKSFRYTGIVHEQLTINTATASRLESLKYIRGHGGHQDTSQTVVQKYAKHARWLERWLNDHPDDTRHQFYLGQSIATPASTTKRSSPTSGVSRWGAGMKNARSRRGRSRASFAIRARIPRAPISKAGEMRPSRAEPLCELAQWLRDDKQKRFALAGARGEAGIGDPASRRRLPLRRAGCLRVQGPGGVRHRRLLGRQQGRGEGRVRDAARSGAGRLRRSHPADDRAVRRPERSS